MRRVQTTISLILAALLFSGIVPVGFGPKNTHNLLPISETEQKVHYPGKPVLNFAGPVLGQVIAHDVLIPDGSSEKF